MQEEQAPILSKQRAISPSIRFDKSNIGDLYYLYPYQGGMGYLNCENKGNDYGNRNKTFFRGNHCYACEAG